jgi:hypothetical protein
MKTFATIGIGSLGSISIQHSMFSSWDDRPAGVGAADWVRVSEELGLVITSRQRNPTAERPPCVEGYFVVRVAGAWLRLQEEAGQKPPPSQ